MTNLSCLWVIAVACCYDNSILLHLQQNVSYSRILVGISINNKEQHGIQTLGPDIVASAVGGNNGIVPALAHVEHYKHQAQTLAHLLSLVMQRSAACRALACFTTDTSAKDLAGVNAGTKRHRHFDPLA